MELQIVSVLVHVEVASVVDVMDVGHLVVVAVTVDVLVVVVVVVLVA